jgi:hypothetical protein
VSGKYSGGLTALLNRERERKVTPEPVPEPAPQPVEAPAAPTRVPETQVPQTQVREAQVSGAQVREPGSPGSESGALPQTQVRETRVPRTQVREAQVRESEVTRPAGRFLQIDHAVLDDFLPRLQPYEQLVYLRLFRLTVGFSRTSCTVSHAKLAEKTRLSLSTIKRTCAQLEANGYIRTRAVLGGAPADRGCEFEILEPAQLLGTQVRETRASRTQVRETQVREAQVPESYMNNRKENNEKAPDADAPADVYLIRTIAARLFEAHRGELGFDHGRLQSLVRDALIGQGRVPDDAAIEAAIGGMAI